MRIIRIIEYVKIQWENEECTSIKHKMMKWKYERKKSILAEVEKVEMIVYAMRDLSHRPMNVNADESKQYISTMWRGRLDEI